MFSFLFSQFVCSSPDYCLYQENKEICTSLKYNDSKILNTNDLLNFTTLGHTSLDAIVTDTTSESPINIPSFTYCHLIGYNNLIQYINLTNDDSNSQTLNQIDLSNIDVKAYGNPFSLLSATFRNSTWVYYPNVDFAFSCQIFNTDFASLPSGTVKIYYQVTISEAPTQPATLNFVLSSEASIIFPTDLSCVFHDIQYNGNYIQSLTINGISINPSSQHPISINHHIHLQTIKITAPLLSISSSYDELAKTFNLFSNCLINELHDLEQFSISCDSITLEQLTSSSSSISGPNALNITTNSFSFKKSTQNTQFSTRIHLSSSSNYITVSSDKKLSIDLDSNNQFFFSDIDSAKLLSSSITENSLPYKIHTHNDLNSIFVSALNSLNLFFDNQAESFTVNLPCIIVTDRYTPSYSIRVHITDSIIFNNKFEVEFTKGDGCLVASGSWNHKPISMQKLVSIDWPKSTTITLKSEDSSNEFPSFVLLNSGSSATILPRTYYTEYCVCKDQSVLCQRQCAKPEINTIKQIVSVSSLSTIIPALINRKRDSIITITPYVDENSLSLQLPQLHSSICFIGQKDFNLDITFNITEEISHGSLKFGNIKATISRTGNDSLPFNLQSLQLTKSDITLKTQIILSSFTSDSYSIKNYGQTLNTSSLNLNLADISSPLDLSSISSSDLLYVNFSFFTQSILIKGSTLSIGSYIEYPLSSIVSYTLKPADKLIITIDSDSNFSINIEPSNLSPTPVSIYCDSISNGSSFALHNGCFTFSYDYAPLLSLLSISDSELHLSSYKDLSLVSQFSEISSSTLFCDSALTSQTSFSFQADGNLNISDEGTFYIITSHNDVKIGASIESSSVTVDATSYSQTSSDFLILKFPGSSTSKCSLKIEGSAEDRAVPTVVIDRANSSQKLNLNIKKFNPKSVISSCMRNIIFTSKEMITSPDLCVASVKASEFRNLCQEMNYDNVAIISYDEFDNQLSMNPEGMSFTISESTDLVAPILTKFSGKNIEISSLTNMVENVNLIFNDSDILGTQLTLNNLFVYPLFSLDSSNVYQQTTMPFQSLVMKKCSFETSSSNPWTYKMMAREIVTDFQSITGEIMTNGGIDVNNFVLDDQLYSIKLSITSNSIVITNENEDKQQIFVHQTATIAVPDNANIVVNRGNKETLRYTLILKTKKSATIRFDDSWENSKFMTEDKGMIIIEAENPENIKENIITLEAKKENQIPWISCNGVSVEIRYDPLPAPTIKPTVEVTTITTTSKPKSSSPTAIMVVFGVIIALLSGIVIVLLILRKKSEENKITESGANETLLEENI